MQKPKFKNTPNFQVISKEDNCKYWISRSIAVVVIPFFRTDKLYVPLGRRSPKMELFPQHWGIVSGFLDWGESACECARREVWEELGIDLNDYGGIEEQPRFVYSQPNNEENQTVSLRFPFYCKTEKLPVLSPQCNEVVDTFWCCISNEQHKYTEKSLAFNHAELIDWGVFQVPPF